MAWNTKTRISALSLVVALPFTVVSVPDQRAPANPVGITVETGTPDQIALVEWAIERFELAGLSEPSLEIHFHEDVEVCSMRLGVYRHSERRLDMCIGDEMGVVARKTMLHEIAHSWINENLSDADRSEFLAVRGVQNWNDHDDAWQQRGTEHAAEIMAWGLMDDRLWLTRFSPSDPADLGEAYELLTGQPPVLRAADEERVITEQKYRG